MDFLSILGVLVGAASIIMGNSLAGGSLSFLLNFHAFLIVVGGTVGATLLHFPPATILHSIKILRWVIVPEKINLQRQIKKIIDWSALARKEGLLGLEGVAEREKDPFAAKGLQLLVDGNEPDVIADCLAVEINTRERRIYKAASVFTAMGGYSPTIGILGAVIGLIHVMQNLANPELLGSGIATAFVATIYGVGFANLLFLPIANKLKNQALVISHAQEMMLEGIRSIAEGENPRNIQLRLSGYLV
ncbi:flagellar motor protein [methane-oxidizing endosymbiont of Gigantopelta aegis]|uniref:flagellar motor protein n=1 Tax=methane-oxidizing endosymbiont of Gigantopelta aegis TaxID=2794938 RepID=UPI0018DE59DA|nr:flagellar motor protein [methane-oxidizing endosymbiont of Gigantopelta aegis]